MQGNNPQISIKPKHVKAMELDIAEDIEIKSERVSGLDRSSSSQVQFEPNEVDQQKRFGCMHVEVDGKKYTKNDIRNLIKADEDMAINLDMTRKCCSLLRKRLKDERRKRRVRREDFRQMNMLLLRYSEDQG